MIFATEFFFCPTAECRCFITNKYATIFYGRYADYYERTIYNHIISTQNPETGGYVYFTPVRPDSYRVYSAPNELCWVGTGMEKSW